MKTYIYKAFMGICMTGAFTACDLDVIPPSDISTETFWKTENDVWLQLNSVANTLPDHRLHDEKMTDNMHTDKTWEGAGAYLPENAISAGNAPESYYFGGIRECNVFLANVDKAEISEDLKKQLKAEVRFHRAMQYLNLTNKFGKVAIVEDVMPYDAPNVERNSLEEVHKFILNELQTAADDLKGYVFDGSGRFKEKSRVSRAAALALRARAALYFGNYPEAEKSAWTVISEGGHELYKQTGDLTEAQKKEADEMKHFIDADKLAAAGGNIDDFVRGIFNYETLWHEANANPDNPEIILCRERAPMAGGGATVWLYQYIGVEQLNGKDRGYSSFVPTQNMVDSYWDIDGKTVRQPRTPMERATLYQDFYVDNQIYLYDIYKEKKTEDNWQSGKKEYYAKVQELTKKLEKIPYMEEFCNRDSRLYASILFPMKGWHEPKVANGEFYYRYMLYGNDYSGGNESPIGYTLRKFSCLDPYNNIYNASDYPIIRYAEVLLTFAEAHIVNTGWDQEVQTQLNQLRDRCGMPDVPTSMGSQEEALEFVRNERRIELFGEGHRFEDIRRYGKEYAAKQMNIDIYSISMINQLVDIKMKEDNKLEIESVTKKPISEIVYKDRIWDDRLMLLPIDQGALNTNPLLKDDQNPGY